MQNMEPHGIHKQMVLDCFSVIFASGLKVILVADAEDKFWVWVTYLAYMSRQKSEQSEPISCTRHIFAQIRGFRLCSDFVQRRYGTSLANPK